jgi:hypothetical protein
MKKNKHILACAMVVCVLSSILNITVLAAEQNEYPVEISVMTIEERNALFTQEGCTPTTGITFLPLNNSSGTNGNICAPFTADKTNIAFAIVTAPGATDYNVQLYVGTYGEGVKASNYATVIIDNGAYFTGLTIGQDYYFKISSSTLTQNGSNASYVMVTY